MHFEFCTSCFVLGMFVSCVAGIIARIIILLTDKWLYYRRQRRHDRLIAKYSYEEWDKLKKILQNKEEDDKL